MPLGGSGTTVHTLQARIEATGAQGFADQLGSATESVSSLQGAVAGAGAVIAGGFAAALGTAVSESIKFEEQMADVEKVTSEAVADELTQDIKDLSAEIPIARGELATLAEQAGKFGAESTEEINQFVETVGQIQTATDLAADEAGTRFAKIAGAVGLPLTEIDKLGNATNALADSMKTDANEITDTAVRVSNTLSQRMGLGEDSILAMSASMNEVNSSSRLAAGGLRRAAEALLDPKKVSDIAGALGMSTDAFRQMRDENPEQLMNQVATQMAEGGETAQALSEALGTQATRAFSQLGSQLDRTEEAQGTVNEQFANGTSLAREMEIRTETAAGKMQLLRNRLSNAADTIGSRLLPVFKGLLDVALTVATAFETLNERTDGLAGVIVGVGGVIGGVTVALGGLAGALSASTVATAAATGAMGSLATAFTVLTGPIGIAIAAVAGLYAAWQTNLFGIRDVTQTAISEVRAVMDTHVDPILSKLGQIADIIAVRASPAIERLGEVVDRVLPPIASAFRATFQVVGSVVSTTADLILTTINATLSLLLGDTDEALSLFSGFFDRTLGKIETWLETWQVVPLIKASLANAHEALVQFVDGAVTYLTGPAVENAKAAVATLVSGMVTAFSNLATAILGGGGEGGGGEGIIPSLFSSVADYISSIGMEDVKNAAHALGVGVRTVLLQFFEWGETFSSIITGFITDVAEYIGSGQAYEDIKAAFSLLGGGIKTVLLTFFEWGGIIAGVVTDFIVAFGEYIGSGQAYEDIKTAFSLLGGGIETVLLTFFEWGETFSSIITGFITDVAEYIGSGQAYEDITAAFGTLLDGATAVFEAFVDGLLYGSLIPDFFSDLADFIGSGEGFSAIVGAFGDLLEWVSGDVDSWSLPSDIKGRVDDALTKIENMASDFKDAGKDLMSSVAEGIENKVGDVKGAAEGAMGTVRDYLPGSDAEEGPLRDLTSASEALPRTFARGIERHLQPVKRAADDLASAAKPQPAQGAGPRPQVDPAALVGAAPSPEVPTGRLADAVAAGQQQPRQQSGRNRNRAQERRSREVDTSRVSDPDLDLQRQFERALEQVTKERDRKIEEEVAKQIGDAARNTRHR